MARLLAARVVDVLGERSETVAFCESLTAGLASATLADIPGASRVLKGGFVTYATESKASVAGVPADVLATEGPVAASTAEAMAGGVREAFGSTFGVSLTGVAGPEPQDGHPVGEVFVAVSGPRGCVAKPASMGEIVEVLGSVGGSFSQIKIGSEDTVGLSGSRAEIRLQSVIVAYSRLLQAVG
ncbi:CinA family protein [Corynebacterium aquilae]|uniref:CinA C-terminal domain-containing protein n=1 Tax=Corynebacterium aquilae DSM 44791 TaxID=1431546 RepID=A0A1L7CGG6_9CORY|nr:nicotinamide-nucleotide amidohydrolase family protein [Corynebacterium aquilae]APT84938.1 hypothetical protein CAQU_07510 [Corynebacterium aquilae DSM 44791]